MAAEIYISEEALPPNQSRCPKCASLHSIDASRVAMPKSTGAKAALESFLAEIGNEQVRLKCPKCNTTYETQTNASSTASQSTLPGVTASDGVMNVNELATTTPKQERSASFFQSLVSKIGFGKTARNANQPTTVPEKILKRLQEQSTSQEAIQLFEREIVPLGPVALEAVPHLLNKLATLKIVCGGNALKGICYSGYIAIPGNFGEQGHSIAITSMVDSIQPKNISFTDLSVIERGICGSVKRGATGEKVVRALEKFQDTAREVAEFSERQFEDGSEGQRFVRGEFKKWQKELLEALQHIEKISKPADSGQPQPNLTEKATMIDANFDKGSKATALPQNKLKSQPSEPSTSQKTTSQPVGNRTGQNNDVATKQNAPAAEPAQNSNSASKVSLRCECGFHGQVKSEYAGRTVQCPKCQAKIRVPVEPPKSGPI
jgi:hypothetical protein